jgi:transposase-like protein
MVRYANAKLYRRDKVVGIFPNTASLLQLVTAVLQDQHDEWQGRRRPSVSNRWLVCSIPTVGR